MTMSNERRVREWLKYKSTSYLKFRVWDYGQKKWFKEDDQDWLPYYGFSWGGEVLVIQTPRAWRVSGDYEVEQFSGVIDTDGVDIYEGDIVDCDGRIGVVEFYDGCFWVFSLDDVVGIKSESSPLISEVGSAVELKVLGNIHENTLNKFLKEMRRRNESHASSPAQVEE